MIDHPWNDKKVIIRTVGEIIVGYVDTVTPQEIVLSNASWIADTGRWHDFLRDGTTQQLEVEPYLDEVRVGRGVIVTWSLWRHNLLRKQR